MMQKLFLLSLCLFAFLSPHQAQSQNTEISLTEFIEPIYALHIEDFNEEYIDVSWDLIEDQEETDYYIYGSDKPDFQIDEAILVEICKENRARIYTAYPYYYVLVHSQGKLSEPSPRIALKDFFCDECKEKTYVQSPRVSTDVWESVLPYLLPEDHPAKAALDDIFGRIRAVASLSAMKAAGFINPTLLRRDLIVGKHPDLPGYLLKIFLDNSPQKEWKNWLERINGAIIVKKAIEKYNYHDKMKVPKKWIYPLPDNPPPSGKAPYPKSFLIVVEDMDLIPMKDTQKYYKNSVTKSQLKALFNILYDCKMTDSMLPKNVPFSTDGRIAFVDTEHTGKSPWIKAVIRRFRRFLSSSMKDYWDKLCDEVKAKNSISNTNDDIVEFVGEFNGNACLLKKFERPLGVSQDTWEQIEPYLIPENHPAKIVLDNIFSSTRALTSLEDFKKAGFFRNKLNRKKMLVSGHPRLKGYLVKAYMDDFTCEVWHEWTRRARGARLVQESIDKHKYNNILKVAKKWIYPLPDVPAASTGPGFVTQHFILVVQDLGIVSDEANSYRYVNFIKQYHLDALYTVVMECLLYDSMIIENIPFCYDNKIAFVDTEMFNMQGTPKKLTLLNRALSSEMKKYWLKLIDQGGPKSYGKNILENECAALGFR